MVPNAQVVAERVDEYPVMVQVFVVVAGVRQLLWEGSQRALFKKYAAKRAESMEEIKAAVSTVL